MTRFRAAVGSALFLLVAPGAAAGLVPWLLTRWHMAAPVHDWLAFRIIGGIVLAAGAAVLLQAFARFVLEGAGTPAPVAEPERLVVGGLYRYVRNPMYLAVTAVIVGQALLLGQLILFPYAALFLAVVWSFVHWHEEPHLRKLYGDEYETYRRDVPGWLPNLRRTR